MTKPAFDLTIIIPNYNTKGLLRDCIASIYAYTRNIAFEIICIDDNSRDGSADMVKCEFPQVILIRNEVNQNYVRNNNMGLRMAKGRYACLLNSDTVIRENAFKNLVHFMDEHPDIGACGPKLLNPDGTVQHCVRGFAGALTMLLQGIGWFKLFPKSSVVNRYYQTQINYSVPQQVDSIGTTAFVIRRSTWENAGMLDERFPMHASDLVYNYMLKSKGIKVFYAPCAEVIHFGSQTVNQKALKGIRDIHVALVRFSDYYDYFGAGKLTKVTVRLAVWCRYLIKVCEFYIGRDKRVVKGPGAPRSAGI